MEQAGSWTISAVGTKVATPMKTDTSIVIVTLLPSTNVMQISISVGMEVASYTMDGHILHP